MLNSKIPCFVAAAMLLVSSFTDSSGCGLDQDARSKAIQKRVLLEQIQILELAVHHPQQQLEKLFGGKVNLETVRHPDKITGFLLPAGGGIDSLKVLHDRRQPFKLAAEDQKEISGLLTGHGNYEWGARYLCEIRYGIRLEFQKADNVVAIFLCLGCGHSGVLLGEKKYEHDMRSEYLDKRVAFAAVAEIVKRALPEAEAIQKISIEKRKNSYNSEPYQQQIERLRNELNSL